MSPIARRLGRPAGALLGIVAIVFTAETAVMAIPVSTGLAAIDSRIAILDGLLLALLVSAPIYWLMGRTCATTRRTASTRCTAH